MLKRLIILLVVIASVMMITSCVTKHPKCAAYDEVQKVEK